MGKLVQIVNGHKTKYKLVAISHCRTIYTCSPKPYQTWLFHLAAILRYASELSRNHTEVHEIENDGWFTITVPFIHQVIVESEEHDKRDKLLRSGNVNGAYFDAQQYSIEKIVSSDKKLIIIEGAPGVGKSTFTRELCWMWGEWRKSHCSGHDKLGMYSEKAFLWDESPWEQYSMVIRFDLGGATIKELSDLFKTCENVEDRDYILKEVNKKKGKGLLLVLDAWDELPESPKSVDFLRKLVEKRVLKHCTVVVTCRHSARNEFTNCKKVMQKYSIVGFNHQNIATFINKVFSDQKERDEFSEYVKNPILSSAMYIPINAVIIVKIYRENAGEHDLLSLTDLYCKFCWHHFKKAEGSSPPSFVDLVHAEKFESQSKFAFNHIEKSHVDANQRNPVNYGDFFVEVANEDKTEIYFPHTTIKEFLAACYIVYYKDNEIVKLFKKHKGEQWNVVWMFVAGLKKMNFFHNEEKDSRFVSIKHWDDTKYSYVNKLTFQCFFESQDSDFKLTCTGDNHSVLVSIRPDKYAPLDAYAAGWCMAKCDSPWLVICHNTRLAKSFLKGLNCNVSSVHPNSTTTSHGVVKRLLIAHGTGLEDEYLTLVEESKKFITIDYINVFDHNHYIPQTTHEIVSMHLTL